MFNFKNSSLQGTHAVSVAMTYFTMRGYIVSLPLNDIQPYDLIFERDEKLYKVQVKSCKGNCVELRTTTNNNKKVPIKPEKFDYLFVLNGSYNTFLIPSASIKTFTQIDLRKYQDFCLEKSL